MAHIYSTLVLHCMDPRFQRAITDHLESLGLQGDYDRVSLAGAAKNIASPAKAAHRETAMDQIAISRELHGVSTVILINHEDCGAYGGRAAFGSYEAEQAAHLTDMKGAAEMIREAHPEMEVRMLLARMDDAGSVSFEEVP